MLVDELSLDQPGTLEVTLSGGTSITAIAVDAVWLRVNPTGRNFLLDSSIHDSFYRCASIHGTNDVTISKTVAYNVVGHCFYLEDGVEERNVLSFNLASHIISIGTPAAGAGQIGTFLRETDELRNPADGAAAGFYITNARNWIYGNAASGGWTGFSFPNLPYPLGAFQGIDFDWFNPLTRLELEFDGNSAHSAGIDWHGAGNCVYVGGRLTHDANNDNLLLYHSGRNTRESLDNKQQRAANIFTNLLVFLCNKGINHWGNNVEVMNYEAIDVRTGAVLFGEAYLHNVLIQASTTNIESTIPSHLGFQFYDSTVLFPR
jgi:hypothetical protein